MIVLVIIGILASLALPQYTSYVEKARAAEAIRMMGAIKTAVAIYELETNVVAEDISQIDIQNIPTTNAAAVTAGQYWYYQLNHIMSMPEATFRPSYRIKATRSTKEGGSNSQYIQLEWEAKGLYRWLGNHPGTPKE